MPLSTTAIDHVGRARRDVPRVRRVDAEISAVGDVLQVPLVAVDVERVVGPQHHSRRIVGRRETGDAGGFEPGRGDFRTRPCRRPPKTAPAMRRRTSRARHASACRRRRRAWHPERCPGWRFSGTPARVRVPQTSRSGAARGAMRPCPRRLPWPCSDRTPAPRSTSAHTTSPRRRSALTNCVAAAALTGVGERGRRDCPRR